MFIQKTRTNQLRVGMVCSYIGESRPKGTLGRVLRITKDSTIVIQWQLRGGIAEQVYKAKPETSYVWGVVLFAVEVPEESTMQTVTLLTIFNHLTIELIPSQITLIEKSAEGQHLISSGVINITKAFKQDGQYFELKPLKLTPVPQIELNRGLTTT